MIRFKYFSFNGDMFYQEPTVIPFEHYGLTLFKGKNFDGMPTDKSHPTSNGTGKTRLVQILEGFIYGKNPRGNFKRTILPDFSGELCLVDNFNDEWIFKFDFKENEWTILKNGLPFEMSHKPSDRQDKLQEILGLTQKDWGYFVHINQKSMAILMMGKPAERRAYLEGFFNIDTFYELKFSEYKKKLESLNAEIEVLRTLKTRLNEAEAILSLLPDEEWLLNQITFSNAVLELLKARSAKASVGQNHINQQIRDWEEYYRLFPEIQGMNLEELKIEQASLIKEQTLLEQKIQNQINLKKFINTKLKPHAGKRLETLTDPEYPKPDPLSVTEKEIAITHMREKLKLKKKINELKKSKAGIEIPQIDNIEQVKTQLYAEKLILQKHQSLLSQGKSVCPTCDQPLTHILGEISLTEKQKEISERLAEIKKEEAVINYAVKCIAELARLSAEIDLLTLQFNGYPNYGVKLAEAEAEILIIREQVDSWNKYETSIKANSEWQKIQDNLDTEASLLGYPDILSEDYQPQIEKIKQHLGDLDLDIRKGEQFADLASHVASYEDITNLTTKRDDLENIIKNYTSSIDELNVCKGEWGAGAGTVQEFKRNIAAYKKQIENQDSLEREYRILEALNSFFSPKGFKLYELKKRCQALVERANYWSKLFFQEPYEWSMNDDLDDLDLLVCPTKHKNTVPYSVGLLSAGEGNRASRVLLFSLLELIPPNKRSNLLFLDEIEGFLDEAGMIAFTDIVLPKLKETFSDKNLVIISHHPSLSTSEVIDHLWFATKKDRKTTLSVSPFYRGKSYG
jgi:DNA repair exonuclease SbcCD ATPase subunit